jgi:energy-converting hydrogenase Eha subunit C
MIVILGVVIFVSLGFWLYLIRLHFRVVYGLAEITFAVFTGLIAIAEHLNYTSILWWLPLSSAGFIGKIFAAYYVAVRALDNVANGLREHESYYRKKGDEWWEKFWHRAARLWDFISFKD